jgi:GT2 family glycosyltransferase
MPEKIEIAIVILNWNGKNLFNTFLPSVIRNSDYPEVTVYMADNGSTDDSVNFLKINYPSVKIIELKKNYGFAEGYNQALRQIEAGYFVLLNSDVKVTSNWLQPCIDLLKKNKSLAVVQPKILSYEKPYEFEYAGAGGGFIDKFGYPFCRGRILNCTEHDNGQYDSISYIFWASGACMFIKSEVFRQAGGFDGQFWAHMEEIDLCWRLKNNGYEIAFQPESVVYHLGGGTLPYSSPQKIYLNFRNNLFMLFKNLPANKFKRIFFSRFILDMVAAAKFFSGFYFSGFWAVIKAHISFFRNLPRLREKRSALTGNTTQKEHKEIYSKSIMWKFFIQKKRKFSELNFHTEYGRSSR